MGQTHRIRDRHRSTVGVSKADAAAVADADLSQQAIDHQRRVVKGALRLRCLRRRLDTLLLGPFLSATFVHHDQAKPIKIEAVWGCGWGWGTEFGEMEANLTVLLQPSLSLLHKRRFLLSGFTLGANFGRRGAPAMEVVLTSKAKRVGLGARLLLCLVNARQLAAMSERTSPTREAALQQRAEICHRCKMALIVTLSAHKLI